LHEKQQGLGGDKGCRVFVERGRAGAGRLNRNGRRKLNFKKKRKKERKKAWMKRLDGGQTKSRSSGEVKLMKDDATSWGSSSGERWALIIEDENMF